MKHSWVHSDAEPAEQPPAFCVGRHADPAEAVTGLLCQVCYRRMTSLLTGLPGVCAWLHANIAAGGTPLGERVSGSREAPTPLRLEVLDMIGPTNGDRISCGNPADQVGLQNIPDALLSWAQTVADERLTPLPDQRDIHSLCAWLQRQAGWIADQSWVDEFLDELHLLDREAAAVAPWRAELLRDKREPCSHCDVLALVQHVAEGRVVCERGLGGCGRSREVTEYEWRTRHLRTQEGQAS